MVAMRVVSPKREEGADADLDPNTHSLQKFTLYETRARFYLVGRDRSQTHWRVLKIDRSEPADLSISEDPVIYTQLECKNLLHRVAEGNRATGGLNLVTKAYGIVGFIKFLESYYMMLVTKRRQIGTLCGHAIYGIEENQLIVVPHSSVQSDVAHSKAELRYKKLLSSVDVTKDFFFSYTYPIMLSLQRNALSGESKYIPYDNMFVWNAFLTRGIRERLGNTRWTVALVHGYFEQAKLSIFGRVFSLTLIARRSRHFAGTRYLKRGVNDRGRVANDVETEQIVLDEDYHLKRGQMSSVVQNRGSIPLFWSQEASRLSPKPDIILQRYDPIYQATKLHFDDLSRRYGDPIIILNLIKTVEKRPREMMLRREFANAVGYLNQILVEEKRLKFIHWDFHKFAKSKSANVLAVLGAVASEALDLTSIYYSGKPHNAKQKLQQRQSSSSLDSRLGSVSPPLLIADLGRISPGLDYGSSASSNSSGRESSSEKEQKDKGQEKDYLKPPTYQNGVLRTNCIDCLDRTNVAQYAYGLVALGRQLHAVGLAQIPKVDPDSSIAAALMDMYQNMGDALALQYGGSAAHNTVFPERQGKWKATTQSQEFLKSIKRYYSNTYTDGEKQDAINLFLGHFHPQEGKPALWELDSDYYLHVGGYRDESPVMGKRLSPQKSSLIVSSLVDNKSPLPRILSYQDDFHRVKLTSFDKLIQVTCGTLKNVRTHTESDIKNGIGGTMPGTAPDAAEIQLKSPNWLFGHRKHEACDTSPDALQCASEDANDVQTIADSEFDWVSSLGISTEEDMYDRYLMTSTSEHKSWYGSELLPGRVEESEANQHYAKCCQGQDLDPFDHLMRERDYDQYNASIEDAISFQDDSVASVMEAALAEYEYIGADLGCKAAYRTNLSYNTSISKWIFNIGNAV